MKTTLILPDPLVAALKRRATERGTSLSALAVELLHRGLDEKAREPYEPNFPVFRNTGPALIDIADREALYEVLEGERDARLYGRAQPDEALGGATDGAPDEARPDTPSAG